MKGFGIPDNPDNPDKRGTTYCYHIDLIDKNGKIFWQENPAKSLTILTKEMTIVLLVNKRLICIFTRPLLSDLLSFILCQKICIDYAPLGDYGYTILTCYITPFQSTHLPVII